MKADLVRSPESNRKDAQKKNPSRHPESAAGLMRLDFFKSDLWIIGGKEYTTPKDTVPKILEGAFAPSTSSPSHKVSFHYDRKKFAVDRLTSDEPGREYFSWVHSYTAGKGIVDVTLRDDTFVVQLFKGAHDQKFPFTKEEFLDALYASKLNLELDQLEFASDSDDESEVEIPKPPTPSASPIPKR